MKICPKCGKKLDDAVYYCTHCGAALINTDPVAAPAAAESAAAFTANASAAQEGADTESSATTAQNAPTGDVAGGNFAQGQPYANGYGSRGIPYGTGQLYYNPYDHTADFTPADISDNKVMAMILYLCGSIGLLIGLLYKRSAYVTFHLRQVLKLFMLEVLTKICAAIIGFFISLFSIGSIISDLSYGTAGIRSLLFGSAAFTVPLVITGIVSIIILVVKIICFFHVCNGKAIEAPIVRVLRFMR